MGTLGIICLALALLCVLLAGEALHNARRAKELEYWLGEAEKDIIRLRDKLDRLEGGGGSKS